MALVAIASLAASAEAGPLKAACISAKRAIVEKRLSLQPLAAKDMTCQPHLATPSLDVLAVRYCCRTPAEGPGSNLVGYFAVRRSDGRVYEWDFVREAVIEPGYSP